MSLHSILFSFKWKGQDIEVELIVQGRSIKLLTLYISLFGIALVYSVKSRVSLNFASFKLGR